MAVRVVQGGGGSALLKPAKVFHPRNFVEPQSLINQLKDFLLLSLYIEDSDSSICFKVRGETTVETSSWDVFNRHALNACMLPSQFTGKQRPPALYLSPFAPFVTACLHTMKTTSEGKFLLHWHFAVLSTFQVEVLCVPSPHPFDVFG